MNDRTTDAGVLSHIRELMDQEHRLLDAPTRSEDEHEVLRRRRSDKEAENGDPHQQQRHHGQQGVEGDRGGIEAQIVRLEAPPRLPRNPLPAAARCAVALVRLRRVSLRYRLNLTMTGSDAVPEASTEMAETV